MVMLLIGAINLYVGFTGVSDMSDPPPRVIPLAGPYAYDDTRAIIDRISGDDCAGSSDLEDDTDSAVPARITRSKLAPAPEAGSAVATSVDGSITLVSNASDFDESTHSLFNGEFDADSTEGIHDGFPHAVNVFMAGNGENADLADPFTTSLPPSN
jgi:hypothetical protein